MFQSLISNRPAGAGRSMEIIPAGRLSNNRRLLLKASFSGVAYTILPLVPKSAAALPAKVILKFAIRAVPVVGAAVTIVEGAILARDLWNWINDKPEKPPNPPQQVIIIINNNIDNSTKTINIDGCISCKRCANVMLSENPEKLDPGDLDRLSEACPIAYEE